MTIMRNIKSIINRKFKECDEGITLCGTSIKFIVYGQKKMI